MPSTTTLPLIRGGAGTDFLVITASTFADDLIVRSPSSSNVRIERRTGGGQINATGIEDLDIDLGAGADKIEINPLAGSGVILVSVNAGQIVTDTGTTVLVSDPDNPDGLVRQPVFNISPDDARRRDHDRGRRRR